MTGIEARRLEQHVHRTLIDLGIETTHDTGECDRGGPIVGDERHVGRERALLSVEGHDRLALGCGTHDNVPLAVALGELAQIEGVQGLPREVHHVVRYVHDVVDGPSASSDDSLGEPLGTGADRDLTHHAGGVAAAERRIGDAHVHEIGRAPELGRLALDPGKLDVGVHVEHRRDLRRHAHHREAVRAIGCDLAVDHGVAHIVPFGEVKSHRGVVRQDHDAALVLPQPQLATRAVHAAGVNAT